MPRAERPGPRAKGKVSLCDTYRRDARYAVPYKNGGTKAPPYARREVLYNFVPKALIH